MSKAEQQHVATHQQSWRLVSKIQLTKKSLRKKVRPELDFLARGLYVAFPASIAQRQKLLSLKTTHPAREVTDELGNSWICVEIPTFEKSFAFAFEAIVETKDIIYDFDAYPGGQIPTPRRFLRSELGIEKTPEIVKLARTIGRGTTVDKICQAINVVQKHLTYRTQDQEFGAHYAATTREGDCTEYAALLAAILRVLGIGARISVGHLVDELHAITEVHLDGVWTPIDVTNIQEPIFGLPKEFVYLMRANWMQPGGGGKLTTLYYRTRERETPILTSSTDLKKHVTPRVRFLAQEDEPYPFSLFTNSAIAGLKVASYQQRNTIGFSLNNPRSVMVRGSALLMIHHVVWRILPFDLLPGQTQNFVYLKEQFLPGEWSFLALDRGERVLAKATRTVL